MVTLATTKTSKMSRGQCDTDTSAATATPAVGDSSAYKTTRSDAAPNSYKSESQETLFQELRFRLSNELQSTLELEITLRTFFDRVCSIMKCGGLQYQYNDKNITLQFGDTLGNRANYKVSSQKDTLGELTFYRKQAYAEAELAVLEMLIGVLFYPLRNALKYKAALENSYIDSLTGLHNRMSLNIASAREIKLSKRHEKALSLLVIDIDHFKNINDCYGHLCGDAVLAHIAKLIEETLRETDQVFRFGGEEFVALLSETSMHHAELTAERIRKVIAESSVKNGTQTITASASVGVASLTKEDDFDSLFDRADVALYRAKAKGRNQVCCERIGKEIKKIA